VILEQWIIVGAEVARVPLSGDGMIKHPAQHHPIDSPRVHSNADDAPRELIHHDEHPMRAQHDGLAAEQVDAPEAVLGVTDEGEPGRSAIAWRRVIVPGQHSADDILIELDAEGSREDQRNPSAAEAWIAALQLDDRLDEVLRRSLGTGLAASLGREQRLVPAPDQSLVERKQCRGPEGYGDLLQSCVSKKQRTQAEQDAVTRRQIRSPPPRSCEHEELLLDQQILGDERFGAARTKQPSDGAQQGNKQ